MHEDDTSALAIQGPQDKSSHGKNGRKYTCFNIINWIYSILNKQSIYRHMALCFYDVLVSI